MIVFSDFDGTITRENRELTPKFFEILDLIGKNNSEMVIVSGRSLSWGHFFMTHFPQMKAAIMEGGGVILTKDERGEICEELVVSPFEVERLGEFTEKLKAHFPHIPLSVDSFGRKTDRAIEFHLVNESELDDVFAFMHQHNINFTKSNVHVNFWCGEISKFKGVEKFLKEFRPLDHAKDCLFFGDAPNDESMFQFFDNSVGVSNIKNCLGRLSYYPRVILEGEENANADGVYNYLKKFYS